MSRDTGNSDLIQPATHLADDELALWHAIKKISATTASVMRGEIGPDVTGADFSILSRLDELGGPEKALGQSALMKSLGWDKSRLSHQLSRMEARKLIARRKVGRETECALLEKGVRLLSAARPQHAAVIRNYLSQMTAGEAKSIMSLAARL